MIISLSGKKQHGKDTVAKIIQALIIEQDDPTYFNVPVEIPSNQNQGNPAKHNLASFIEAKLYGEGIALEVSSHWERKSFASKLKQMVCLLLGCTMEQLEDNDFKERPLGEEWWVYVILDGNGRFKLISFGADIDWYSQGQPYILKKTTPRILLQLLGTECGRQILHPNIWINAMMADYKPIGYKDEVIKSNIYEAQFQSGKMIGFPTHTVPIYPNWIITDTRFPNEIAAIKKYDPISNLCIRVINPRIESSDKHESETALDNYEDFDYDLINDGDIAQLCNAVRIILKEQNIIK